MGRQEKAERDAAFAAFVEQSTPSLLRTAWLLTGSADAAHELVQASLVKMYAAWHRVRADEALGYARRVLVNHNTDTWRKRRGEHPVAILPEGAHHDATSATTATRSCASWPPSRRSSVASSCCATTATCPSRPLPTSSASPSAPSRAPRRGGSPACAPSTPVPLPPPKGAYGEHHLRGPAARGPSRGSRPAGIRIHRPGRGHRRGATRRAPTPPPASVRRSGSRRRARRRRLAGHGHGPHHNRTARPPPHGTHPELSGLQRPVDQPQRRGGGRPHLASRAARPGDRRSHLHLHRRKGHEHLGRCQGRPGGWRHHLGHGRRLPQPRRRPRARPSHPPDGRRGAWRHGRIHLGRQAAAGNPVPGLRAAVLRHRIRLPASGLRLGGQLGNGPDQ